jgi:hypothetical protein
LALDSVQKNTIFKVALIRDSLVGLATGYGLDDRGVGVRVHVGCGVHPASYPVGTGALSPGLKRPGREADHSPPASAEVKKTWIYTSTLPYAILA